MLSLEKIVSLCKRRGFIYQGSEIYGGLAGTWDYGPLGVILKNNIKELWWNMFVSARDDIYGLDAGILMNQKVWQASGHAEGFSDPLVECKSCHERYRFDHLEGLDDNQCPACGEMNALGAPRQFNMMFQTHVGALQDSSSVSYLRPETAQGIFTNFKNVIDSFHPGMPFGIAQIGKAFRNEIAPRDFLFRAREFEQMEIEWFIHPKTWEKHFEDWRESMWQWIDTIGLSREHVHELEVPESDRAHYSKRTIDFEYDFSFGRSELYGLAYRTDHDLKNHQEHSGVDLSYTDKTTGEKYIPHVIEPSLGLDRTVLALLSESLVEEKLEKETRMVLKLKPLLAPVKVAVFPLLRNKPELVEKAQDVYTKLKKAIPQTMWDDNGNVGKRYRRQDEIGTPLCVTIDFETLDTNTVTVRDRDTMKQERVALSELTAYCENTLT